MSITTWMSVVIMMVRYSTTCSGFSTTPPDKNEAVSLPTKAYDDPTPAG